MSLCEVVPKPFDPSMSSADAYVLLAETAIAMCRYPHDVRGWWRDEKRSRIRYGLGDEHEAEIVEMCRARIAEIGAEAEPHTVI